MKFPILSDRSPIFHVLPPGMMHIRHKIIHVSQIYGLNPNGPTVVLLHGIAASAATWLPLVHFLAPVCRKFIMPDIPGHGLSPAPKPPFDCLEAYYCMRDTLVCLLEPYENNVIIGNSLGGGFALRFSLDNPDLVQKTVLISPAGAPFPTSARDVIEPFLPESLLEAKEIVDRVFVHPNRISELILSPILRCMTHSAGFHSMMASIMAIDDDPGSELGKFLFTPEELTEIDMPTYLIWGKQDKILPREMREFYDTCLPKSVKRQYPENFGHCPQFDETETLAKMLIDFIA